MFPTVTDVTDSFDRADERPLTGGSWQEVTVLGETDPAAMLAVNANVLQGRIDTGLASQHWNEEAGPDVESYLTVTAVTDDPDFLGTAQVRLYVRLQGGGTIGADGYVYELYRSGTSLPRQHAAFRLDEGVMTQLGGLMTPGLSSVVDEGEKVGIECEGTHIRCYLWDPIGVWQQLGERTDATYSVPGTAAVEMEDEVGRHDDWVYGTKIPQSDTSIGHSPKPITRQARF